MTGIDLDIGRKSIRLSQYVYQALLDDVRYFGYDKKIRGRNPNAFFNKLFPNLIWHRAKKRKQLQNYVIANFENCILPQYKYRVLGCFDGIFDLIYFNDFYDDYHEMTLNVRFNKENIPLLEDMVNEIAETGIKTTAYLRNLLNEYVSLGLDTRQRLFFREEISTYNKARNTKQSVYIKCMTGGDTYFPISIEYSHKNGEWYAIATSLDKKQLRVFRLFAITQIKLQMSVDIVFTDDEHDYISNFIKNEKFAEVSEIMLSD